MVIAVCRVDERRGADLAMFAHLVVGNVKEAVVYAASGIQTDSSISAYCRIVRNNAV